MKTIKIEDSYDLGQNFSFNNINACWSKLMNFLRGKENLLNKISIYKDKNMVITQSLDQDNLINIIENINPLDYCKKNLIKTIKLNLKFNKETKKLELINSTNSDLNKISYLTTYNDKDYKNDVYFSEDSLLINYRNLLNSELQNLEYALGVLVLRNTITSTYFIEITDDILNELGYRYSSNNNKIIELINGEQLSDEEYDSIILTLNKNLNYKIYENKLVKEVKTNLFHTEDYILIPYSKMTKKLIYLENVYDENINFNIQNFINQYNNSYENFDFSIFNNIEYNENVIISNNFSNSKFLETKILLKNLSKDELFNFKNSINKYIFDNFIKLQLNEIRY